MTDPPEEYEDYLRYILYMVLVVLWAQTQLVDSNFFFEKGNDLVTKFEPYTQVVEIKDGFYYLILYKNKDLIRTIKSKINKRHD